jgi:Fe-S cluster assembly protein SufD
VLETVTTGRGLERAAVEELARRRREPDWLAELRLAAFAAYEAMPLPDQHTEGWRRTSLRGLLSPPLPEGEGGDTWVPEGDHGAAAAAWERQGVVVRGLAEAARDPTLAERVREHVGRVVVPDLDKFTALHYALLDEGVGVHVPRGVALAEPIWLRHQAAYSHTLLLVDDEAEVTLVDEYEADPALASVVVEQALGRAAHVRYVHLQRRGPEVWSFSAQRARLAADASLRTLNVALGARTARNTVQVVLDGRGAQADLLGVVASDGRQHTDFQTLQDHHGDATRSDLFIHDALRGRASANFTGLIRINPTAHQTESAQVQKNVLLSPRARADSDPKLEILNNDVIRCTHGAAVGPVDEEMIFYLSSRGLDRATAEQLIVEGFFRSILEKLGQPALQAAVWARIADKLAAGGDR